MAEIKPSEKGNTKIKFLSVVVAALVWYVITKNITIITSPSNSNGKANNEKSLADKAAQDTNATGPK